MSAQSAATLRKQAAAPPPTERILSWGRYPKTAHHRVHKPAWNDQVPDILRAAAPNSLLPYGLGRSYGDSCLNAGRELIDCRRLNRILGFDESTGMLRCESGASQLVHFPPHLAGEIEASIMVGDRIAVHGVRPLRRRFRRSRESRPRRPT